MPHRAALTSLLPRTPGNIYIRSRTRNTRTTRLSGGTTRIPASAFFSPSTTSLSSRISSPIRSRWRGFTIRTPTRKAALAGSAATLKNLLPSASAIPRMLRLPVQMKWTIQILGYLAVILFGVVSGFMLRNWQLAPVVESYQQIMEHPLDACRVLLQPYMSVAPQQNELVAPSQVPQQASPQPPQQKAPATKGNNGKQ